MQWSTEDLLFRLPSNAVIRQAMDGKLPFPQRGTLHAIYENQIYRAQAEKSRSRNEKKARRSQHSQQAAANSNA